MARLIAVEGNVVVLVITALHVALLAAALPAPPVPSPPPAGSLEWEARIVGSASYAGLLQVRRRGTSAWGTVCDDFFNNDAAKAACRSAGFANATGAGARYITGAQRSPGGSGSILLDNVRCTSGDTYLDNCTKVTSHNCDHTKDVTINCFPNDAFDNPPPANASQWEYQLDSSSRLLVRPTSVSAWGFVSLSSSAPANTDAMRTTAAITCRSLGFTPVAASAAESSVVVNSGTAMYWRDLFLGGPACAASGSDLTVAGTASACVGLGAGTVTFHTEFEASATGVVALPVVKCTSERRWHAAERNPLSRGWQFRFVDDDLPTEGTNSAFQGGVLLMRPGASYPWGLVCLRGFTPDAAAAACRSLGFQVPRGAVQVTSASLGRGMSPTPIYLDNVRCDPTAVAGGEPLLPQCSTTLDLNGRPSTGCQYTQVVQLQCGPVAASSTTTSTPQTTKAASSDSGSQSGSGDSGSNLLSGQSIIIIAAVNGGIFCFCVVPGLIYWSIRRSRGTPVIAHGPTNGREMTLSVPEPASSGDHKESASNRAIYGQDGGPPPPQWPPAGNLPFAVHATSSDAPPWQSYAPNRVAFAPPSGGAY